MNRMEPIQIQIRISKYKLQNNFKILRFEYSSKDFNWLRKKLNKKYNNKEFKWPNRNSKFYFPIKSLKIFCRILRSIMAAPLFNKKQVH